MMLTLILIITLVIPSTIQQPEINWSLSLRRAGPIQIGMSLSEVRKVLEDPDAYLVWYDPDDTDGVNGCTYLESDLLPTEIGIMFKRQRVVRIEVWGGMVKTISGIGVGDTEERIKTLYPGKIRVERHPYTDGHYLIYTPREKKYRDYGMIFETENNRVTSFRAGLMTAVILVEGCS